MLCASPRADASRCTAERPLRASPPGYLVACPSPVLPTRCLFLVKVRASDSAVNPHLASALTLAAGLEGIEQRLDPGLSRGHENLYAKLSEESSKLLPRDLGEAVDAFEADPLAKAVFGERMYAAWVDYKRAEWQDYCKHVSEWEVRRYLRQFG